MRNCEIFASCLRCIRRIDAVEAGQQLKDLDAVGGAFVGPVAVAAAWVTPELCGDDWLRCLWSPRRRNCEGGAMGLLDRHAVLVRDPRIQYDGNAIGIQIGGRPVGHLSREDAARYAPVFDEAKCPAVAVDAVIRGGWDRGGSDQGHYGVSLDLPTPEELIADLR